MNEQLIIRLPASNKAPVLWLVWNASENTTVASGKLDSLDDLASLTEKAQGRGLRVFVSSLAVALHDVEIPQKSRRHLATMIPFALEDELAEDIDRLHFAWPESLPKGDQIPVLVVAKQAIKTWRTALASANLHPQALYPDFFMLPVAEQQWSVADFGEAWVIRQGDWQAVSLDAHLASYVQPNEDEVLAKIRYYGELDWPQPPAVLEPGDETLALELGAKLDLAHAVNLLQGEYRVQQTSAFDFGPWKFPAMAAGVAVALLFASKVVSIQELEREAQQVRAQYEALYLQTFPDETRIANIRAQLQEHVQRTGGGSGGGVVLLLNELAPAFRAAPLELTSMNYDHQRGELRIQANGQNLQSFERFVRAAREQALNAEQGQLANRGGQINGTIIIRSGS